MVIGSKYPTVLAWSLSSCRSTLTVLLRVTWCSSFHPKRWYETKLSGSGRSLYVFPTIAWSQSITVSGRKKWSALPNVVGGPEVSEARTNVKDILKVLRGKAVEDPALKTY